MRNKILLLLFALTIASPAFAATTHYSYNTPTVGGSQNTWGTLLNTIFNTIDSNIWSASGGMTAGVNAQSSAANITLTNPINSVQNITMSTTGKKLILPAMNVTSSMITGGQYLTVNNVGSNSFDVDAQDGTTGVLVGLAGGKSVQIQLLTNSTANGTFQTYGPYLTSVSGNVSLGTSAAASNPANATAANTGLFSTTTGQVNVGVLGSTVGTFTATGINNTVVGATTAAAGTFTTATATTFSGTNAALSGTTTTNNLTITGTCVGCGISKVSTQTFCASGCTHTSGTYTPTAGTKFIISQIVGGGGGSGGLATTGSAGSPGAAGGGGAVVLITAAQIGTPTITVGAAGSAGTTGPTNGGAGGTTSIGSLVSCTGGGGSTANVAGGVNAGPAGGACTISTGTAVTPPVAGQAGASGGNFNSASYGGTGGSSLLGIGGNYTWIVSTGGAVGLAPSGFGGGGGGSAQISGSGEAGSAGGGGLVSFTEYQ